MKEISKGNQKERRRSEKERTSMGHSCRSKENYKGGKEKNRNGEEQKNSKRIAGRY